MGLTGHLVSGFITALAAAFLTHWLGERRRTDPLTISVRLKQLEVAATLYARFRALMESNEESSTAIPGDPIKSLEREKESERLYRELLQYYGHAFIYLPEAIGKQYESIIHLIIDLQKWLPLGRSRSYGSTEVDNLMEEIGERERALVKLVREEFVIDDMILPTKRRRASSQEKPQPFSMPPPEAA